jgi:ubiquinone/menaquinone biosynthesis C-methylase UbiE
MKPKSEQEHQNDIVKQFSKQAIPFTQIPGHYDAMQVLLEMSGVNDDDEVLDVACGPGMVACEFARHAKHVTGVDITAAMINQAQKKQLNQNLINLDWVLGEAVSLPYGDNQFSLVITRYSFHHFLSPEKALAEMTRVCKPGGRVLVADVVVEPDKSECYDRLEILRDPSHTHALTKDEFAEIFGKSNLVECRRSGYIVDIELEAQLKASFPNPGDEHVIREMVMKDIGKNHIGINARNVDGQIHYSVPIAVFVGRKI